MIRSCPACGANNRFPAKHLSDTGRCGSCKAALPPVAEPIEVDARAFAEITCEAKVRSWWTFGRPGAVPAGWPPEVHELAREMAGRCLVLKVNTEEYQDDRHSVSGSVDSLFCALAQGSNHRRADGSCSTGRNAAMVRNGGVIGPTPR
jgi:thioredoxin 2